VTGESLVLKKYFAGFLLRKALFYGGKNPIFPTFPAYNISKILALCWAKFLFSTVVSPVTFTVYVKWDKQVNVTKDTSSCFISQMFGKLEFRKSENAFICQIAIFKLFHHLNLTFWK